MSTPATIQYQGQVYKLATIYQAGDLVFDQKGKRIDIYLQRAVGRD
jgi:hypothetical protein